jgi:hypothetical protein
MPTIERDISMTASSQDSDPPVALRYGCAADVLAARLRESAPQGCPTDAISGQSIADESLNVLRRRHKHALHAIEAHEATIDYYDEVVRSAPATDPLCPFCKLRCVDVDWYWFGIGGYREHFVKTRRCSGCAWWYTLETVVVEDEWQESLTVYPSLLLSYDLTAADVPIAILQEELGKSPVILNEMNPARLELLVRDILHGAYQCDVYHVGRTGDGGIDLIVLDSDRPLAVQVKRRSRANSVERIEVVREFLGAMVSQGFQRGLFVTTACRYSRGARRLIDLVARNASSITHLEFWNCRRLIEVQGLLDPPPEWRPWRELSPYDHARRALDGTKHRCLYWKDSSFGGGRSIS